MELMEVVRLETPTWRNLQKHNCLDIKDFYRRAKKFMRIDNAKENLGKVCIKESSQNVSSKKQRNNQVAVVIYQGDKKQRLVERVAHPSLPWYSSYTELNKDHESIFLSTKGRVSFKKPPPIRKNRKKRNPRNTTATTRILDMRLMTV